MGTEFFDGLGTKSSGESTDRSNVDFPIENRETHGGALLQKLILLLKKDKVRNLVILLGLGGILLIYFSTLFSSSPSKDADPLPESAESDSTGDYERDLELRLSQLVIAITGEEAPQVMVTLSQDRSYVYANDERSKVSEKNQENESQINHDSERSYIVLKDAEGNQHPLTVTQLQPEVKGVVVVSQAAENAVVQERLVHAVKTAVGLPSSKICVVSQYQGGFA